MKHKRVLLDLIIVALIGVLFVFALKDRDTLQRGDVIAIIYLNGTIGGTGQNTFNADDISKVLNKVRAIKPKGVIVRISSPGGSAYESDKIYNLLLDFKLKEKIPLFVSMADECASGGYYISMAGDRIFAEPYTITGSIGVIITLVNYEELLKKVGINVITLKSGPYKDTGSPFREMGEYEKAMFQKIVDEFYSNFLHIVSKNRKNIDYDTLEHRIAQGQIYTGSEAVKLGLVDKIGDLNSVIEEMKNTLKLKSISIREFRIKKSLFETFLSTAKEFFDIQNEPSKILIEYRSKF
uniref:Signal peptide peptidase SppA n=1 Tax=Caldisericum exile TaxID=693075 RepID=A0A7C4Y6K0_9BACT